MTNRIKSHTYALSIGAKISDLGWPWTADTHSVPILSQLLSILENRFSVTGSSLEWFRSYLTSYPSFHCWLNFYTSSSPRFRCSTRFWSGSSRVRRIHWNHYRYLQSSLSTKFSTTFADDTQCYDHCAVVFYPACQLVSMIWTHFFTLPAAQPVKNWIHFVWF